MKKFKDPYEVLMFAADEVQSMAHQFDGALIQMQDAGDYYESVYKQTQVESKTCRKIEDMLRSLARKHSVNQF